MFGLALVLRIVSVASLSTVFGYINSVHVVVIKGSRQNRSLCVQQSAVRQ